RARFHSAPTRPHRLAFFFQAEDGIRDGHVTGVQTCALPILLSTSHSPARRPAMHELTSTPLRTAAVTRGASSGKPSRIAPTILKSEERRVGKESRSRWAPEH